MHVSDYKISLAQLKCWLPRDLSEPSTLYIQLGEGGCVSREKIIKLVVGSCSNDKA